MKEQREMSGTAEDDRLGRTGIVNMHQMCINLWGKYWILWISLFKSQNKSPLLHTLLSGETRAAYME